MRFETFKVGDIFGIETPKRKINACDAVFGIGHPYVVRSAANNGIRGYIEEDERWLNDGNTIAFGQDTGTIFYQPEPYFTGDKIKVMRLLKHELDEPTALYLIAAMKRGFAGFSWGSSSFNVNVLKAVEIVLPADEQGDPDFAYMAERIKELEAERIKELEAYLIATGLNDYELDDDDKELLARAWKEVGKFRIGDLFEKLESPYYGKGARHSDISNTRADEHCVPVTTAKKGDNGICRWAREGQFKTYENVISIVYNGAIAAGLAYYQPGPVAALTDSYLIRLKDGDLNERAGLYLACAIQKSAKAKYSRENKAIWKRVCNDFIALPATDDGKPDYEYMAAFIRAQQKLAIADAVRLKDKIIAKTAEIVA